MFRYETKKKREDKGEDVILTNYQSVSDLNMTIKDALDTRFPTSLSVTGELSNYKIANSNLFATLKDAESCISIAYWGYSYKNVVEYKNGDRVKVSGKLTLYQKGGNYSIMVNKIEKIGVNPGDLHTQMEENKKRYEQLGYFANKKRVPTRVDRIGIVTALEGAALQDILYVLKKGKFRGKVVIYPSMVQGNKSARSIANGIQFLNEWVDTDDGGKKLDIVLVTRGGGSFEDLISFSSDEVIEAIHESSIFTISAVGHEIDFMLSDFVADHRAPTPSVSAEFICALQDGIDAEFDMIEEFVSDKMRSIITNRIYDYLKTVMTLKNNLQDPSKSTETDLRSLDQIENNVRKIMETRLQLMRSSLDKITSSLSKYDTNTQLDNGFSVVIKGFSVVDSVKGLKSGQKLKIKLKDGEIDVIVV